MSYNRSASTTERENYIYSYTRLLWEKEYYQKCRFDELSCIFSYTLTDKGDKGKNTDLLSRIGFIQNGFIFLIYE